MYSVIGNFVLLSYANWPCNESIEYRVSSIEHNSGIVRCRRNHATLRCGTVRCGAIRYGAIRYGAVRYGTVRCDTLLFTQHQKKTTNHSAFRWTTIMGGTIPEITMRYVSRYLSHDTIRITILH